MTKKTSTRAADADVTVYVVRSAQGVRVLPPRQADDRTVLKEVTVPAGRILPPWVATDLAEHLADVGLAQRVTLPRTARPRPVRVRPADDPALVLPAPPRGTRRRYQVSGAAVTIRTEGNPGQTLYRGDMLPTTAHPDDVSHLLNEGLVTLVETTLRTA